MNGPAILFSGTPLRERLHFVKAEDKDAVLVDVGVRECERFGRVDPVTPAEIRGVDDAAWEVAFLFLAFQPERVRGIHR